MSSNKSKKIKAKDEIPVVFEIHNFGAPRVIPTYIGNYFLKADLSWERDPKLAKVIRSEPFVEVRKKLDLTGMTVQVLRRIASKRRIKESSRLNKSELIKRLGGIVLCQLQGM